MALQYWRSIDRFGKCRLMTWRGGYHGDTFTPMSVCDPDGGMHSLWRDVLAEQIFAPPVPGDYDPGYVSAFEAQLSRHADELAAVIVEPVVQGAGGMRFHDPRYLTDLRRICDDHDVLLIFDEIATGFGRTGELFAADHAGVSPDVMCVGKALTGGYITLAATLCTAAIAEKISGGDAGALMHGPTFMANALACAVAATAAALARSAAAFSKTGLEAARIRAAHEKWWPEAKAKAEGRPEPGGKPQHPDARMKGNARPGNIHSGVLAPSIGYGIKGAIWYQGESNSGRAYQYRELFPFMIQSWREEWGLGDFPFYWVQLADYLAEKPEPAESAWAELREAQTMTMKKLPNTGEAVIIDIGEGKDIHPKNKQDVAKRLARWALTETYKVPGIPCRSPIYTAMEKQGPKAVLSFDNVAGGWRPFDVAEPVGFTIANADRKFVAAQAKILPDGRIEVWSDAVADPVAVRYAWADNPVCNMYSAAGLPLTPFRTDDFPGVTATAN
jgi:hypothetical protein